MLLGVVWGTPDALLGLLGLHIPSVGVDMTLAGPILVTFGALDPYEAPCRLQIRGEETHWEVDPRLEPP